MTREEAIDIFEHNWTRLVNADYTEEELNKAIEMAIKALEQEPCEDCVSREVVNKLVDELARAISDERCCMSRGRSTATIMQEILDLPSVQPKRDKGDKE